MTIRLSSDDIADIGKVLEWTNHRITRLDKLMAHRKDLIERADAMESILETCEINDD